MYKILDGLYQGGVEGIESLPDDVTAVVNLLSKIEHPADYPDRITHHIWLSIHDQDWPGIQWVNSAVKIVDGLETAGLGVYIHCAAGISRSTMLTAAYLIYIGWATIDGKGRFVDTVNKAIGFIGEINPSTNPRKEFIDGLKKWQFHVRERS